MSFTVPDSYREQLSAAELAERSEWLTALPALAADHADAWGLTRDGAPLHGFVGVVWPVRTPDGTPAM